MKVHGLFLASILLVFAFFNVGSVFAQLDPSNTGTVVNIEINDPEAEIGDILTVGLDGIIRSTTPYDSKIFGVIVQSPIVSSGEITDSTVPVLSAGRALVKVSSANGVIERGDFVTTSETPGVGQKATDTGFVLGRALDSYDADEVGLVSVQISVVEFGKRSTSAIGLLGTILTALNVGLSDSENFPLVLRYISAGLVATVTFLIAAFSFVRFMTGGIQAIGRNPMAKRVIIAGMVLNATIVLILTIAGFGIAIALIVL